MPNRLITPEEFQRQIGESMREKAEAAKLAHAIENGDLQEDNGSFTLTGDEENLIVAALRAYVPHGDVPREDWKGRYEEEWKIVDRCWKALGIHTYEGANGKAIDEIIAEAVKDGKRWDWYERENPVCDTLQGGWGVWRDQDLDAIRGKSLREAIDNAMADGSNNSEGPSK